MAKETTVERQTYNIPEVAKIMGVSNYIAYEMAASGKLPAIRVGAKRVVVPRQVFHQWLETAQFSPKASES